MIDMDHRFDDKDLKVDANTALHVIALAEKGDEFMEAIEGGSADALNTVFMKSVNKLMDEKKGLDL